MPSSEFLQSLGFFLASEAKIPLERFYDRTGQTQALQELHRLPKATRRGIAGLLNLAATFADRYMRDDTLIRKFAKELITDAGSEMGKRVINGTSEDREFYKTFLKLGPDNLASLLIWLRDTPDGDRQEIIRRLSALSTEEILLLINMPPEQFALFASYFWKKEEVKSPPLDPGKVLATVKDGIRGIFLKPKRR